MLAVERKSGMNTVKAKHTRFKQKAATLNYDGSLNITIKNIQKLR